MKRFKYSYILILLLLPSLVFGGMGLKLGSDRLGPNSFGIPLSLRDNLQILIYNRNITTSTLYDWANQYDFYQGTADNQGVVTTGPPNYVTLTTNDSYPLQEIDDETGITAHQLATIATGARYKATGLDISQYATESGNRQYRIVFGDAAGKKAWAYIGGADSAEAFGSEKITNGNNEAAATTFGAGDSNDSASYAQSAAQAHGGSNSALVTKTSVGVGNYGRLLWDNNLSVLTAGVSYYCYTWVYLPSGQTTNSITVLVRGNGANYNTIQTVSTKDAWVQVGPWYSTTKTEMLIYIRGDAGAQNDIFYIDDTSVVPVNSFGTTAVKLYNAVSGGAQSLVGNSGIDPNAITSVEVYKVVGSDNLTGDQTHEITVKLADGRPASAEVLFAMDSGAAGTRKIYAAIETTGKVTLYASEDGTNYETVQTDDPVFADGAATVFTDLIFALDKTTGTGVIYVDGAAVATTETITTGTLFDTYRPLEIGAKNGASYLNSAVGHYKSLNTAVTATQALDMANSDAVQALLNL